MNYFSKPCLWPLFYSILQAVRRLECLTGCLVSLVNFPPRVLSVEPETEVPSWLPKIHISLPQCILVSGKWLQAFSSPLASRWGHMTNYLIGGMKKLMIKFTYGKLLIVKNERDPARTK